MSSPCLSCGRSSGHLQAVTIADRVVHSSPSHMVYAYRDGEQIGLCDSCFRQGRFDGLSRDEIEYFIDCFDTASSDDPVT